MSIFSKLKNIKKQADRVKDFTNRIQDGEIADNRRERIIEDTGRLAGGLQNIEKIKANLQNGLASTNRYAVLISTPASLQQDAAFLTFRASRVNLPGKNFLTSEAKPKGFGSVIRYPYQAAFGQLGISFLTDDTMKEYKYFTAWMDSIIKGPNNKSRSTPGFDLASYRDSYNCLITIFTYSKEGKVTYTNFVADAYPNSLEPVQLGWANGSEALEFNVIFEYAHHYDEGVKDALDGVPNLLGGINSSQVSQVTNILDVAFGAFGIDSRIPQDIRDIDSVVRGGLRFL